jgi:hypothetical protein
VTQDVTVIINGSNDPPAANPGTVHYGFRYLWHLPDSGLGITHDDVNEAVTVNSVDSSSGGTAVVRPPDAISFTDHGTLGVLFSYDVTDGTATNAPATPTFDNNPSSSTNLTGLDGVDDIIIGDNAGETLTGGADDDILISNAAGRR